MKNWNTLQKNDKLYLLIPYYDENNNIRYRYQESHVINIHQYDWCTNVRFKYTNDNGKRCRVELCINKLKYDNNVVASKKETGWARDNDLELGDIIVSFYKYDLEVILKKVIEKTIKIEEKRALEIKKFIKHLQDLYSDIKIG